jgi:hypothetical protein
MSTASSDLKVLTQPESWFYTGADSRIPSKWHDADLPVVQVVCHAHAGIGLDKLNREVR